MFVVSSFSRRSPHDDNDDHVALELQCRAVTCSHQQTTLRPSTSYPSAPETSTTSPGDRELAADPAVSPRRMLTGGRRPQRPILVLHNSFNSYFRPALVSRRQRPLVPPRSPEQSPDQQQLPPTSGSHSDLASFPLHGVYRKQVVRDARSLRMTPSMKRRQLAGALRSSRVLSPTVDVVVGGGGALTRHRSVVGHVANGTVAAPSSVNLGRRNTVVGGGPVDHPTPLSLRDIYQLSRRGSFHHNRHAVYSRRLSTFTIVHRDKEGAATSSRATVGVARCGSARSRRLLSKQVSVDSGLRSDSGGVGTSAVNGRRRHSDMTYVEQKQSLAKDQSLDSDMSPPPGHRDQDNALRDATKTHTFDIFLVSFVIIMQIRRIT